MKPMLSFTNRFHGHGSLRFVYAKGQVARSRSFLIKHTNNPRRQTPRVAVVVSKKVIKSAVKRNRIRRRLYEVIRAELPAMAAHSDVVCIVTSTDVLIMPHDELASSIRRVLKQANLYNQPKN